MTEGEYRLKDIVEVKRCTFDTEASELLAAGWRLLHVGSRQWTEYRDNDGRKVNITRKDVCYVLGRPCEEGEGNTDE